MPHRGALHARKGAQEMKLRKFRGPDIRTVMDQVRQALGEDAVILDTHDVIEGGISGFFGTRAIEVVAAISGGPEGTINKESDARTGPRRELDLTVPAAPPNDSSAFLRGEDDEIQPEVELVDSDIDATAPVIKDRKAMLLERGLAAHQLPAERTVNKQVHSHDEGGFVPLALSLENKQEVRASRELPKRAVFLGLAGSGKTSAVGRFAWQHTADRPVTVVSLEEEGRLSGAVRWREFWETIGVEFVTVFEASGLLELDVSDDRAILVDTPPMPIAEVESWLEELIAALPGFDVCIVADSHMDAFELELLMQRCSNVGATILMLTKVDELLSSGRLGSLLSIPGLPAFYLTESTTITSPPLPAGRRELRGIGSQGA